MLLAGLCIFSPPVVHDAYAATNPAGTTVKNISLINTTDRILNNYGTILGGAIDSDDNFLTGMYAKGGIAGYNLINIGDITIITTTHASDTYGMYAYITASGNHTLTNIGTMTISVIDDVHGMNASAQHGSHNLSNSGTITVSGNDQVYGMLVEGTGTHNISNTGYIKATASGGNAYEAYGENNYNVGTWATTLRNWSGTDAVFGAGAGAGVNVNLANSTLIFRPGTAAQGFALGKDMPLANLVVVNGTATETTLGKVTTEVPFLKAVVTGTTTGTVANPTYVRLESNVSESTTPGSATMQQAVSQVQGQFNNLSTSLRNALVEIYTQANLVADAGQNSTSGIAAGSNFAPSNKWQVFINPYANTVNNSKLDYNGNNMGITAGASYRVNDNFSFGGHLDFNSANYYGELMDMSTKSTSFALGLHAAFNFTPECYLRGQLTGSVNQNDSYYETGVAAPLTADSTYNGEAIYAALSTGYIWQFGQGHSLTPEVGLSYLGTHTGAYDIKWSGPTAAGLGGMYDMSYDDSYYNAFYANFNLDWRSEWELQNNKSLALLVGAGLRQKLSANDMEASLRMLGSKYTTQYTEDPTTFLVNAGLEYNIDNFSVSLNYGGGFGAHQTSHGGNVMVKLEF